MSMTDTAISSLIDRKLTEPANPPDHPPAEDRNLGKGILAGLIAGIVGTAAKTLVEQLYPPRVEGQAEPTDVLADKVSNQVAGHDLAPTPRLIASESIHWAFGATIGAAYGAIAEYYPQATSRDGVNFGMTLMALTHESALPAMGLSASPKDQSSREKSSEVASHIAYGLVVETTRRLVRKML